MKSDESFLYFILDQISLIPDITYRKMFGSWGLYQREQFFGIVSQGVLYLKTNQKIVSKFINYGMKPFAPNKTQTLKNYFEVPGDILENREELARWVRESIGDI